MKKLVLITMIAASLVTATAAFARRSSSSGRSHTVRPHVRKDGALVEGHRRTNRNETQRDNWSTKGNTNPATGKEGTRTPHK